MKKTGWIAVFLLSISIFMISLGLIIYFNYPKENTSKKYIETTSNNVTSTIKSSLADNHSINWKKLKKHNSDVYAWIYVPNTKVDYPVLQATPEETDGFYLDHNLDKKYEFAGSIYSEMQTNKDFTDPVSVLYGHNMKNGSMFNTLHRFENSKFFKKNDKIYIYLPKRRLTYKIYSAYIYDDRHILNSFDFTDEKILKAYQKFTMKPDSINRNYRNVKHLLITNY